MSVIGFVILHYGNVQVTQDCVASILQLHTEDDIRVVVVDNDTNKSVDERQELKDTVLLSSQVEVIQMQEKSGFSRANNEGYMYIRKMYNPDYIVMTNNDIVFTQVDFIDKIKLSYVNCRYAVLSPDVISRESGEHQSPIGMIERKLWQTNYTIAMNWICLRLFPLVYPFIKSRFQGVKNTDCETKTYLEDIVPCGACIVFSRLFIALEESAFYPETEFYYEEYILHYRCKVLKYKIVFDPALNVIHGDGVATKKSIEDEKRRVKFVMENMLRSAKIYKEFLVTNRMM